MGPDSIFISNLGVARQCCDCVSAATDARAFVATPIEAAADFVDGPLAVREIRRPRRLCTGHVACALSEIVSDIVDVGLAVRSRVARDAGSAL